MSGTRRGAGLGTPLGGSKAKRRTRARGRAIALWRAGRDLELDPGATRGGTIFIYYGPDTVQKQPFPNVWKQSFFLDPRAVQRERRRAARAVTRYVRHTCDKRAALFPGT